MSDFQAMLEMLTKAGIEYSFRDLRISGKTKLTVYHKSGGWFVMYFDEIKGNLIETKVNE